MDPFHSMILILVAVAALILLKKSSNRVAIVMAPVLVLILGAETILFLIADWFTGQGVDDSVIFHLKFGVEGAGFSDYSGLFIWGSVGLVLFILMAWLTANRLRGLPTSSGFAPTALFLGLLTAATLVHPAATGYFSSQASPLRLIITEEHGDFARHYRNPAIGSATGKPKNFVLVFMESVERSYLDESVFPGLIVGLKDLERNGIAFTQVEQLPWTGWTIGGMTASTCGLPLFTPSHANYSMKGMQHFLPAATCLGDLLVKEGYSLSYLSGSSVEFASTGKLFSSHGFSSVAGIEQLNKTMPDADTSGWGMRDDALLEHAFEQFEKKSQFPAPFGLVISTIDTHPPTGRLSPACSRRQYRDGGNEMLNAMACTDEVISRFARRIFESEHADNTVVILASDHLTLPSQASGLLEQTDRKNFLLMLDPARSPAKLEKRGSHLDIGPTILSAIGYEGDLALGRSLFSDEPSIVETVPDLTPKMNSWYSSIIQFWGFPQMNEGSLVKIHEDGDSIDLDGASFNPPLLVEIKPTGETVIRFDSTHEKHHLYDFVGRMMPRRAFIWVDDCSSVARLMKAPGDGICLVHGHSAGKDFKLQVVDGDIVLTRDDVLGDPAPEFPTRTTSQWQEQAADQERVIAHAGGMVKGRKYTNTLDALTLNYAKGLRKFELDIIRTSDGHFVAAHDWPLWKRMAGFEGELPPTLESFLVTPILGDLTPLDMDRVNNWFSEHPDAILVTDKVNTPAEFARQFIDKNRLVMELFSIEAVEEGIATGIRSAMPSGNLLRRLGKDPATTLAGMGVTEVAMSRTLINTSRALLDELREAGIRVYVFHVNRSRWHDEKFALCSDLDFVFGFYADQYDFHNPPDCSTF